VKEVATRWPGPEGPPAVEREGGDVTWPGPYGPSALVWTGGMKDQAAKRCRKGDGDGDEAAGSRGTSALEREDGEGGGEVAGSRRSVLVSTAGRKDQAAKGCRKGDGDGDEAAGSKGTSALERDDGEGGGDVARSRRTPCARVDSREEGGGEGMLEG
jgi:hypothetical protein